MSSERLSGARTIDWTMSREPAVPHSGQLKATIKYLLLAGYSRLKPKRCPGRDRARSTVHGYGASRLGIAWPDFNRGYSIMKVLANLAMISKGDDPDAHCWRVRSACFRSSSQLLDVRCRNLVEALLTTGIAFVAQKSGKEPAPKRSCGLGGPETVTL